jgi:hypothetical protein
MRPAPIGISVETHGEPSGSGDSYHFGKTLRGGCRRETGSRPNQKVLPGRVHPEVSGPWAVPARRFSGPPISAVHGY